MGSTFRLLLFLLLLPGLAAAEETLTLGVFAFRPKPATTAQYQMLGVYLGGALPGYRVRVEAFTVPEMAAAIAAKRIDFVFTNPSHFVQLRHEGSVSGAIATLMARENGKATTALGGVILAPAGRGDIATLADLRGKRIAIPGTQFFGGYQVQAYELMQAGLNLPAAAQLLDVGGHDQVIETLLAGRVDAGFVRTGLIEAMAREGKLPAGRLKIINRQTHPDFPYAVSTRLYPEWAFAALPHVPEDVVRRVARALLFITPDMAVAETVGMSGFTIPSNYEPVEQLTRALRLPPYEKPEFQAADVWQRYRWTIVAGVAGTVLVILLAMGVAASNRRLRREQAKLAESEQRLALTIEGANLGQWDWHIPTGRVTFNERLARILGYAPEEVEPSLAFGDQLIHPADRAALHAALQRHLAGETPRFHSTHRQQRKDGHWIWVLDAGQVCERDATGQPVRVRGIYLDITEAKEAETALEQRERHLQTLLTSMADVVFVIDTAGRIAECHWPVNGPPAPDIASWPGRDCFEVLPPSLADTIGDIMGELIVDAGKPLQREIEWPLADGTHWFSATFSALKLAADSYPQGFLCVAHDITERKTEEVALILSRAEIERLSRRNQLLLEAAGEGIYGVDHDGNITFINPSAQDMLGLTEAEALGKNAHLLFHRRQENGEPYPAAKCPLTQTLMDGQRRDVDDIFVRKNGASFHVHLVATPVIDDARQVGAEVVFLDITSRKAMEEELTRLAATDSLTGVANRRHFMAQAEAELARSQRFGQPAALLMLDLDHFKRINDTHGHAAGDLVLKSFADAVRATLRKIDVIGRLGGEEFAVLLPGSDLDDAAKFAERSRLAVENAKTTIGPLTIGVTVSIGIALMDRADADPDAALARADEALYRAKAMGRNRVEISTA